MIIFHCYCNKIYTKCKIERETTFHRKRIVFDQVFLHLLKLSLLKVTLKTLDKTPVEFVFSNSMKIHCHNLNTCFFINIRE